MNTFNEFGLPEFLVKSLEEMQITTPTPVQIEAIPPALEGKNILASAQTGTGKTIAYLIPLIIKLSKEPQEKAIILTPTRELAIQVQEAAKRLLGRSQIFSSVLLIGGEALPKQLSVLRKNPRLIIGTPGRINDLLNRSMLNLSNASFLVLDEVDRMLDMGFAEQLDDIVKHLPKERQSLMFSATMPTNIERLVKKYLDNPHRISVGAENQPIAKIKQDVIYTANSEKFNLLSKELETREGCVIIFVKTKHRAEQLADTLHDNNHSVRAIHGGLRQQKREKVIKDFRDRKSRIMVATDIAARGLDVPHIQHVINYDLPQCPEDYLHRIGRTGRAGAEGCALSLISPDEEHKWRAISRLINDHEFESTGFSRSPRPSSGSGSGPRRSSSFGNRSPRGGGSGGGSFGGRKPYRGGDRSETSGDSGNSEAPRSAADGETSGGFRPRNTDGESSGGFRPRSSESGSFRPRSSGGESGGFRPRSSESGSFRPRSSGGESGGFRSRNSDGESSGFRPRSSGGESGGFRPRSSGGESGGFRPRSSESGSFRPRSESGDFRSRNAGRSEGFERSASDTGSSENTRGSGDFGQSNRFRGSGNGGRFGNSSGRSGGSGERTFSKSFARKKQYISES